MSGVGGQGVCVGGCMGRVDDSPQAAESRMRELKLIGKEYRTHNGDLLVKISFMHVPINDSTMPFTIA